MFKDIHSEYLISLGQLCDNVCTVIIDTKLIHVVKFTHLVLSGKRKQMDGLWEITLTSSLSSFTAIE